jgi:hypothetical protein
LMKTYLKFFHKLTNYTTSWPPKATQHFRVNEYSVMFYKWSLKWGKWSSNLVQSSLGFFFHNLLTSLDVSLCTLSWSFWKFWTIDENGLSKKKCS